MSNYVEFGNKIAFHPGYYIKEYIEEVGLTQEDFANLMEVSRQTISSLENGKYNPSIFLAYKISNFFNLKIEDVFIFEETSNKKN